MKRVDVAVVIRQDAAVFEGARGHALLGAFADRPVLSREQVAKVDDGGGIKALRTDGLGAKQVMAGDGRAVWCLRIEHKRRDAVGVIGDDQVWWECTAIESVGVILFEAWQKWQTRFTGRRERVQTRSETIAVPIWLSGLDHITRLVERNQLNKFGMDVDAVQTLVVVLNDDLSIGGNVVDPLGADDKFAHAVPLPLERIVAGVARQLITQWGSGS
jgi:hypothetical protein